MKSKDTKFYLDSLESEECQCGAWKRTKMSFCYACYKSLPDHLQSRLYRGMLNGYEEAYEEAAAWLRDKEARG